MFSFLLVAAFVPLGALSSVARSSVITSDAGGLQEGDYDQHGPPRQSNGNWLGWGADVYNNRLAAPDAIVNAANVASLHPVCQKEYSKGVSATPLVVDGIVYYPTWSGLLVALDYNKCKVLWQTNISEISLAYKPVPTQLRTIVNTGSRTTPTLSGNVLILGAQANALLLAVDKRSGKLVDQIQLNDHPTAVITMSPTVWQGRIFVGTASDEESVAGFIPGYVCCSFAGNMNGLVFQYGHFRLLWTQKMVPIGSNFSGGAIWGSQPAIDPARNRVLIGTGNVYSVPDSYTACRNKIANTNATNSQNTTDPCAPPGLYQESVIAFDTTTGHIAWFREFNPLDAWNLACLPGFTTINPGACPPNPGPDADFGMAPTFIPASPNTPSGEDTIVIGQKNGNLYGLSAQDGKLFWATATSPDGTEGGLIWGVAVDSSAIYYTAVNTLRTPWQLQDGTKFLERCIWRGVFEQWEDFVGKSDTAQWLVACAALGRQRRGPCRSFRAVCGNLAEDTSRYPASPEQAHRGYHQGNDAGHLLAGRHCHCPGLCHVRNWIPAYAKWHVQRVQGQQVKYEDQDEALNRKASRDCHLCYRLKNVSKALVLYTSTIGLRKITNKIGLICLSL